MLLITFDPANRLVADALESDWNSKLRAVEEAQQEYERRRQGDRRIFTEEERARIVALATDFPRLWQSAETPDRERKRMVRLLLEDVTLLRDQQITLHVRFKSGVAKTLHLPLAPNAWQKRMTRAPVLEEMRTLIGEHTDRETAALLNARGLSSGTGKPFTPWIVAKLRRKFGLKSIYLRLREKGMLTGQEMAKLLGISPRYVKIWRAHGLLSAHVYNDRGEYLYDPPGPNPPRKMQGLRGKLCNRPRFIPVISDRTEEVQCET